MIGNFTGWDHVAASLQQAAAQQSPKLRAQGGRDAWLNEGQRATVRAIAQRIANHGVLIADEVGMGKTRIAVQLTKSVVEAGGRVAILVPPGLGYQWEDELSTGEVRNVPPVLRSLRAYFSVYGENPAPWFREPVLLISHAFTNWRIREDGNPWRRALLPEVYAQWRKKLSGRLPRNYHDNEDLGHKWVKRAACNIVDAIPCTGDHPARPLLDEILENCSWQSIFEADYARETEHRRWLEGVVGLGLGAFDLTIIDEAHKSRGSESGLSRLLNHVILPSVDARRLGMTATPVELDVGQWWSTLERIGLEEQEFEPLKTAIHTYARAAKRVRRGWRTSSEARNDYKKAAIEYSRALRPYVLRRDKREDEAVQRFAEHTGLPISQYREESEINIELGGLPPTWQQAICAAEALSFATRQADDPVSKRLRLTLGSGHGIATLLDHGQRSEEDRKQEDEDNQQGEGSQDGVADARDDDVDAAEEKRRARAAWWQTVIARAFDDGGGKETPLFDHPALVAAAHAIEAEVQKGEKVLVFGRFTRPMRALVQLLNARAMLRALKEGRPWPQTKVHGDGQGDGDEWLAVRAAHRQLRHALALEPLDESSLDAALQRQYSRFESRRQRLRDSLIDRLNEGFELLGKEADQSCRSALEAFSRAAAHPGSEERQLVLRALLEHIDPAHSSDTRSLSPDLLARTFCELVQSASDRDDPDIDIDGDGDISEFEADVFWNRITKRIQTEFGRTQGRFARLMHGETLPESRRLLQLAFNRPFSDPRVLVAQSLVGREGLNLHKACRIVVMLHPEWNPGVAEQQIGRIDRVGSHWARAVEQAVESGDPLPRMQVRPVIFRGTYDEHNWAVLRERWDDLRAQLHGIVVPDRIGAVDDESRRILEEIAASAPSFSPLRCVG